MPFAVVTYYALRGGSYDVVVRQGEAVVVWAALAVGAGLGFLPRATFPRGAALPLAAVALLALWTALSLAWSDSAERTLPEAARVIHYAGVVLLVWCVVDRDTWTAAVGGVAAAALLICGVALASRLAPDALGESDVTRVLGTKRLAEPLNDWNALAAWAGMSMAMALAYSAHARRRLVRSLALAAVPVCGAVAYLTYSRGGTVGVTLGVLAVIVLSRNRWVAAVHTLAAGLATWFVIEQIRGERQIVEGVGGGGAGRVTAALLAASAVCAVIAMFTSAARGDVRWRLPRRIGRRAAGVAAVGAVVAAAVVGVVYGDDLWHEFTSPDAPARSFDPRVGVTIPRASRYLHWRSALEDFGDHPVAGTGAGTSVFRLDRVLPGPDTDTHSLYIEQLAELGLPGLLLTLAFLGGLLAAALRAGRHVPGIVRGAYVAALAAFAVFLADAFSEGIWDLPALSVLALVAVALAAAAGAAPRLPPLGARVAIVAVALVACFAQVPGLVSNLRIRDSQESFRKADLGRALNQASDAIASQPWAAAPYAQRALVAESGRDLGSARRDLLRAIARARTDYRYRLLLARVEAERGRPRAAIVAFQRAQKLNPDGAFTVPP